MNRRPLLFAALLLLTPIARADAPKAREIKHKSQDLEKIKADISEKKQEKEELQKKAADLSSRVKQDEARINDVEKALENTRRRHDEVQQKVASAKIRHDDLVSRLGEERVAFNGAADQYYVACLLEGPNGLAPVYGRQALIARGSAIRSTRDEANKEHANLDELVTASTILRSEAQKQENKLTDIRSTQRDRKKQLSKTLTRQELLDNELKDLQQSAEQVASLIESLRSRAKEAAEQERRDRQARQKAGNSPVLPHSLPWPSAGKISTHFGRQTDPKLGTTIISNGVIITASDRAPVTAVADGKVLYAGNFMGYGNMAVIEHPGDWYSVYGHLADWSVEKGQDVKRGDPVGRTRPRPGGAQYECYFELRFYGKPVDPTPWLARR